MNYLAKTGSYGFCSNRMRISWGAFPQDWARLCNTHARSSPHPLELKQEHKAKTGNKKKGLMMGLVAKVKGE